MASYPLWMNGRRGWIVTVGEDANTCGPRIVEETKQMQKKVLLSLALPAIHTSVDRRCRANAQAIGTSTFICRPVRCSLFL